MYQPYARWGTGFRTLNNWYSLIAFVRISHNNQYFVSSLGMEVRVN